MPRCPNVCSWSKANNPLDPYPDVVFPARARYFPLMRPIAPSTRLPTTLGFAPLDDRARLPGRFFYRLIQGVGRLG